MRGFFFSLFSFSSLCGCDGSSGSSSRTRRPLRRFYGAPHLTGRAVVGYCGHTSRPTLVLVARRGVRFLVLCPRATCPHPTLVEDRGALAIITTAYSEPAGEMCFLYLVYSWHYIHRRYCAIKYSSLFPFRFFLFSCDVDLH